MFFARLDKTREGYAFMYSTSRFNITFVYTQLVFLTIMKRTKCTAILFKFCSIGVREAREYLLLICQITTNLGIFIRRTLWSLSFKSDNLIVLMFIFSTNDCGYGQRIIEAEAILKYRRFKYINYYINDFIQKYYVY